MSQPDLRVTAYWYALHHGLPCDLDSLLALGLVAAREARWLGIPELKVPEGPLLVHTWPESVFEWVVRAGKVPSGMHRDEVTDAFRGRPRKDGFMSCPCGRGDYHLCRNCPYDWCRAHGTGEAWKAEGWDGHDISAVPY